MTSPERQLEEHLIEKLRGLKYEYRADIRDGYQRFKAEKNDQELTAVAGKHGLAITSLQSFADGILQP